MHFSASTFITPYLHQFSEEVQIFGTNLHYIWCKFSIIFLNNWLQNCNFKWGDFIEQHKHQMTKNAPYSMPNLHFFGLLHICKFSGTQKIDPNKQSVHTIFYGLYCTSICTTSNVRSFPRKFHIHVTLRMINQTACHLWFSDNDRQFLTDTKIYILESDLVWGIQSKLIQG